LEAGNDLAGDLKVTLLPGDDELAMEPVWMAELAREIVDPTTCRTSHGRIRRLHP
jgi:hypothetical protein